MSRRSLLQLGSFGIGHVALTSLLAAERPFTDLHARAGHFPPRAKSVIQLLQVGGPSHIDLFDPKPELVKRAGQPHPDGVEIQQAGNENKLMPSPFAFRQHGHSGMAISDQLPGIASIVDELCFVRSMYTEHNNHLV